MKQEQLYPIGTEVFISDESEFKFQQKIDGDGNMEVGVVEAHKPSNEGWMVVKFNSSANSYKMRDLILANPNQEPQYEIY